MNINLFSKNYKLYWTVKELMQKYLSIILEDIKLYLIILKISFTKNLPQPPKV